MYWKLLCASLFHALFGTAAFINLSVLNPIEFLIRDFANQSLQHRGVSSPSPTSISSLWSLLNASYPIGYLLSTFVIALCADRFGRRGTVMVINNVCIIISCGMQVLARQVNSFELLIAGRILAGVVHQVCMFVFIYLIECSDVSNTGMVAMISRSGCILWYVLGAAFGLPQLLGTEDLWHYSFALPALPALVHLAGALFLPESPKHLYITKHDVERSRQALVFYQGQDVDFEAVFESYEKEAVDHRSNSSIGVLEVLRTPHLRWPFAICLMANFSCRTGGFDIENYYSTGIIHQLGVPLEQAALYNIVILRLPSLFLMLITILLIKKLRTRPYMLGTFVGGLLSIAVLFAGQLVNQYWPDAKTLSSVLGVAALFVGISSWHLGAGYLPKFLPGEICPQVSRSITTAYQVAVSGLTAVFFTVLYAPLADLIGAPFVILSIMVLGFVSFAWLWKYLPETKDKTVDQVVAQWKVPEVKDEKSALLPSD